jgi:hypothetical protein
MLFVIDIDGTVADGTKRFKKAGPEPDRSNKAEYTKWVQAINTGIETDRLVIGMKELCISLSKGDAYRSIFNSVVFLTSREEKLRKTTQDWLDSCHLDGLKLVMRPTGNWEDTAILKERAIHILAEGKPVVVIDDDEHSTLEAVCKKNGWTFLKARSGGQK